MVSDHCPVLVGQLLVKK